MALRMFQTYTMFRYYGFDIFGIHATMPFLASQNRDLPGWRSSASWPAQDWLYLVTRPWGLQGMLQWLGPYQLETHTHNIYIYIYIYYVYIYIHIYIMYTCTFAIHLPLITYAIHIHIHLWTFPNNTGSAIAICLVWDRPSSPSCGPVWGAYLCGKVYPQTMPVIGQERSRSIAFSITRTALPDGKQ